MALSTSQSRNAWSPACRSKGALFTSAFEALDACLRRYGYQPGYGTGCYNCRPITNGSGYSLHAYGPGVAFRFWNGYRVPSVALAVDINPPQNPYGRRLVTNMPRPMVDAILRIRTNNGKQVWGWGGYFSRFKDSMHYEIVCSRTDLASGINRSTLPGGSATPGPPDPEPQPPEDDDDMAAPYSLWQLSGSTKVYRVAADAQSAQHVGDLNDLRADIDLLTKGGWPSSITIARKPNTSKDPDYYGWLSKIIAAPGSTP